MEVLGAISIRNIESTKPSNMEETCFNVVNTERDEWHLCAETVVAREEWFCAIGELFGNSCNKEVDNTVFVEEIEHIEEPVIIISTPSPYCNEDWDFYGHGNDWECKCTEGYMQSPINLPRKEMAIPVEDAALFDYVKVSADKSRFVWEDGMIKILGTFGTITDVDMAEYEAYEIRIHTPAEHTIRGKRADMELQIVHKPLTEGDFARKAVLSVMFEKRYGAANKFFDSFDFLNLPDRYHSEAEVDSDIDINMLLYDVDGMVLPTHFNYFNYQGSLTTPPCDE